MTLQSRTFLLNALDNALAASVAAFDLTITVQDAGIAPTVPFYIVIDPFSQGDGREYLLVTNTAGTTWTVTRDLEGTESTTHQTTDPGNIIRFAYNKQHLDDIWNALESVVETLDPLLYDFSDSVTAAIASGEWAVNNADITLATEFYIHEDDVQSIDRSLAIEALRENDVITFKASDTDARAAVNLAGDGVLATNVYTFPINAGQVSGSAFVNNDATIISSALGRNLALGQLSDVDVDGVSDLQVLTFVDATGNWEARTSAAGKGITTLEYLYDDNQTATPVAGDISPDNTTPASVTTIFVNEIDALGDDVGFIWGNLKTGDLLRITDKADSGNFEEYVVTTVSTDGTTVTIGVTPNADGGAIADNDPVFIYLFNVLPDLDLVYLRLDTTNDPITGPLDMGSLQITSLADGTLDTDAVSKLQAETDAQARAVAEAIKRMQWRNVWAPGTFEAEDTVYDQGWAMVANKQTSDRAAPQPSGAPVTSLPETPAWSQQQFAGFVAYSNVYTFAVLGSVTGFRIWIEDVDPGVEYTPFLQDRTDPANVITNILDPILGETFPQGWLNVNLPGTTVLPGTIFAVGVFLNDTSSFITFAGNWNFIGSSNVENDPGIGASEYDNAGGVFRINKTDNDLNDRSVDFADIVPGTQIFFGGATNTVNAVIDNGTYLQLIISRIGAEPIQGIYNHVFNNPDAPDVDYVEIGAFWSVPPTWATNIDGELSFDGAPATVSNTAYGTDLEIQVYTSSPDWDLLSSLGGGGSSGGGGGPAPNGLPSGGTAGQHLEKVDATDFNSIWADQLHADLTDITPDDHHVKYTDAEALIQAQTLDHDHATPIAAHDALAETHHTKYTDAEALAQAQTLDHDHATPIAAAIGSHEADAGDPHAAAGYLKQTETDALYVEVGGDTMTGELALPAANPSGATIAAHKAYVDERDALYLPLSGGTLTGFLTLHADPTALLHAATKQYVDAGDTGGYQDPLTTKGDLLRFDALTERFGIGTEDQVLTVVGGIPEWQTAVTGVTDHGLLTNVTTSQHHVRYDDAEAVSANTGIWLSVGGGSLGGELDMTLNKIVNLLTPTVDADASTKKYVDDQVGAIPPQDTDHANLTNVLTSQHHVRYSDAEADARAALQDHDHATPIATHASDVDSHHARYTDAEADARAALQDHDHATPIAAHDAISSAHHTRYTDAEAQAANDGIFLKLSGEAIQTVEGIIALSGTGAQFRGVGSVGNAATPAYAFSTNTGNGMANHPVGGLTLVVNSGQLELDSSGRMTLDTLIGPAMTINGDDDALVIDSSQGSEPRLEFREAGDLIFTAGHKNGDVGIFSHDGRDMVIQVNAKTIMRFPPNTNPFTVDQDMDMSPISNAPNDILNANRITFRNTSGNQSGFIEAFNTSGREIVRFGAGNNSSETDQQFIQITGEGDTGTAAIQFRVGSQASGTFRIDATFFIPVYNATVGSAANVNVVSNGQLTRSTSARKYKSGIRADDTLADLVLQPVRFHHDGDDTNYIGFIADDIPDEDAIVREDGEIENYDLRAVVAILAAKVNRLESA